MECTIENHDTLIKQKFIFDPKKSSRLLKIVLAYCAVNINDLSALLNTTKSNLNTCFLGENNLTNEQTELLMLLLLMFFST